jgi:hypothetical protein
MRPSLAPFLAVKPISDRFCVHWFLHERPGRARVRTHIPPRQVQTCGHALFWEHATSEARDEKGADNASTRAATGQPIDLVRDCDKKGEPLLLRGFALGFVLAQNRALTLAEEKALLAETHKPPRVAQLLARWGRSFGAVPGFRRLVIPCAHSIPLLHLFLRLLALGHGAVGRSGTNGEA